jgi:hypothetical protein
MGHPAPSRSRLPANPGEAVGPGKTMVGAM